MCCMEKDGAVTQRQAEKDDGRHVRLREREKRFKANGHIWLWVSGLMLHHSTCTQERQRYPTIVRCLPTRFSVCVCVVSFSRLLCVKQLKMPRYSLLRRINARKEQAPNGFPF